MAERLKPAYLELNHFKYIRVLKRHKKRIDLLINIDGKEKEVGLPVDFIEMYPKDRDVYIPEFICEKQGLVD